MNFDIMANLEWIGTHIWVALKQMGGVAILTLIFSFIIHKVNTRFEKQIEHKYDKKLEDIKVELDNQRENYKALLEKQNHVWQSNFDREIAAYESLCESFDELTDAISSLFPYGLIVGPELDDEALKKDCNERLKKAVDKYRAANVLLTTKAPFIPKEFYVRFNEIRHLSNIQIFDYHSYNPWAMKNNHSVEKSKESRECYTRTKDIFDRWEKLIDELREYLRALTERKGN